MALDADLRKGEIEHSQCFLYVNTTWLTVILRIGLDLKRYQM
jgi:hypothetical protein